MKFTLALLVVFCISLPAYAESRIIGIEITKNNKQSVTVSIFSDVGTEHKNGLTVEEASKILSDAKGWGSSVEVGIVAHRIRVSDYLPLMKSISDNPWLYLAFIEGREPNFIYENIKRRIEQEH